MPNIIVSGLVRFGTSWIGKMLSLGNDMVQQFEPFHPDHRKIFGNVAIRYYFLYQHDQDQLLNNYINDLVGKRYFFLDELGTCRNVKDYMRFFMKTAPYYGHAMIKRGGILIKDPYAFFLLERLSKYHLFKKVVIIREPGAFVYSFLRDYSWDRHKICYSLFEQKKMIEYWELNDFCGELERFAKFEIEVKKNGLVKIDDEEVRIERAALIWKIFARVYYKMQMKYNIDHDWNFIKYEQIASEPLIAFRNLYKEIGIEFTPKIEKKIYKFSYSGDSESNKLVDLKRNSQALLTLWQNRLSDTQ